MSRTGYPKSDTRVEHYSGEFYNDVSGTLASSYASTASYTSLSADKVGPNSPGYPAHKDETSYLSYEQKNEYSVANFTARAYYNATHGAGSWPFSFISPISDPSAHYFDVESQTEAEATQLCLNKLITNVKGQKVNAMNFAAEFGQTCSLVSSTANRIASAFRAVKRGNISGAVSVLAGGHGGGGGGRGRKPKPKRPTTGSAAQDWLELQYGWLPLLGDINGACEELANRLTYQPDVYKVTGKGSVERVREDVFPSSAPIYPPVYFKVKSKVTCNGVIEYRARSNWADIARTTGLINPLATVWEELPYSFVVDWFVPVGNFLNNLDYDQGIEFSRGWLSVHAEHTFTGAAIPGDRDDGTQTFTWRDGKSLSTVRGYRRTALGSFPNVPAPSFKDPLSLHHVENALALLRTAFGR